MKHVRRFLVVCLIIFFGFVFNIGMSKVNKPEAYKIGAILPLTGPGALWGNNTRKGAELAVDEINRTEGISDRKLILISEDSKGMAKEGVIVLQKLLSIDKVHAIIDDAVSSVALANIPIITKNKICMISTGSTNPDLSGSSSYFFRLWNSDIEEAVISGRFIASELGYGKGVILYIRNDYGDGLQKAFEKEFAKYKGIILGKESFEPGASHFREQLFKLKALNPQFVYMVGYPAEIPRILIEMKKLNFNKKVITTAAIQDKSVVEQAKKAVEGVIYPYAKPAQAEITESFKKAYKQKYGEDPGSPAAEAYDAVMVFTKAFKEAGRDSHKIRDFIASIRHEGASGLIIFDKNGDVHKPMEMKIIRNGKFEVYK